MPTVICVYTENRLESSSSQTQPYMQIRCHVLAPWQCFLDCGGGLIAEGHSERSEQILGVVLKWVGPELPRGGGGLRGVGCASAR